MSSTILYLTNKCNLKCSYCFERYNDDQNFSSLSFEEIDKIIDWLINNEPNEVSSICFFGGEPFLEFDKILYIVKKCEQSRKDFAFSIITNGTLTHKYIDELYKLTHHNRFQFLIFISYDGSFQKYRTKSLVVEKNFNLLLEKKIPFFISYTITKKNYQYNILIKDLILIIKKFISSQNQFDQRIRINFNYKDLYDNIDNLDFDIYKKKLIEYLNYIHLKMNVSFCYLTCDICQKCDFKEEEKIIKKREDN